MTEEKIILEPGTHIDSHWGHYQSVKVIELGMTLDYEDEALDNEQLNRLIEAYNENEDVLLLRYKDGKALYLEPHGFSIAECVHETQDDVENYINENHVPEGHWFGHHADIGDFGVWSVHMDCTPTWCEAACEPNSRCPEFHKGE